MYIYSRAGLGESAQEPVTTSSGDIAYNWLCQGMTRGGTIRPDEGARTIHLKVIFRHSFADFRREVQRAVERWVKDPRIASSLVTASENHLKENHNEMLAEKVPDYSPVWLLVAFFYRATGCIWNPVQLKLPPEPGRWQRMRPNV